MHNADLLPLFARMTVGVFFILARFRWFFDPSRVPHCMNPERHAHLTWKLGVCGWGAHPVIAALVATTEVSAGLGLAFGLLTSLSALGLMVVTFFGTLCTAKEKVLAQSPVDAVDCVSCYLWRVEGPYIAILAGLVFSGGGKYSLDHALGFPRAYGAAMVGVVLILWIVCALLAFKRIETTK